MARKDKANIANGVLSVIVTAAGIVLSTFTQKIVQIATEGHARETPTDYIYVTMFWAIGFLFMIPGFFGVLASVVHVKSLFFTHLGMGITGLVIWVLSFLVRISSSTIRPMFDGTVCNMTGGSCICDPSYLRTLVKAGLTCDEIADMMQAALGYDAMFLIGGVLLLFTTVLSGKYNCSVRKDKIFAGVVFNNTQQLAYTHTPAPMGSIVNPNYIAQPGYAVKPPFADPPRPPPEY